MEKVIIGNATLYHADCLEVLPLLDGVDAVITDPPYGIGRDGEKGSTGKHGGRKAYDFMGWDSAIPEKQVFDLIFEKSRLQVIWGANYFTAHLPPSMGWLFWDKGQRISQSDGELAFTNLPKALRVYTLNRAAVLLDGAEHPTQKPIKLMKWCIRQLGDPATICDPFMGSGSTGVAAMNMKLQFIGIEKERRYFDVACERIDRAQQQLCFL
jgi:DNA modification methylase